MAVDNLTTKKSLGRAGVKPHLHNGSSIDREKIMDFIDRAWMNGKTFTMEINDEGKVKFYYGHRVVGFYNDPGELLKDLFPEWNYGK